MLKRFSFALFVLLCGLISTSVYAQTSYQVVVNNDRSITEMLKDGKFDDAKRAVNARNFPVTETGQTSVSVEFISFTGLPFGEEAATLIDERGYRSATLPEMLAVVAKYPQVLDGDPSEVIVLGSKWKINEKHAAAISMRSMHKQGVTFRMIAPVGATVLGWPDSARFAVVRKK